LRGSVRSSTFREKKNDLDPQPSDAHLSQHADSPRHPLLPVGTTPSSGSHCARKIERRPAPLLARGGRHDASRFFCCSFLSNSQVYRPREERKSVPLPPPPAPPCARSLTFACPGQSHLDRALPKGERPKRSTQQRRPEPDGFASSSSSQWPTCNRRSSSRCAMGVFSPSFGRPLSLSLSLFAPNSISTPGPRLGRAAQGRRRSRPQGQAGPRRRRARPRRRRHGDAGLCRRLGPHPVLAVEAVRGAPEEGGQGPPEEA
jgi:hypothetical protein